jgi:hypothetical protein
MVVRLVGGILKILNCKYYDSVTIRFNDFLLNFPSFSIMENSPGRAGYCNTAKPAPRGR